MGAPPRVLGVRKGRTGATGPGSGRKAKFSRVRIFMSSMHRLGDGRRSSLAFTASAYAEVDRFRDYVEAEEVGETFLPGELKSPGSSTSRELELPLPALTEWVDDNDPFDDPLFLEEMLRMTPLPVEAVEDEEEEALPPTPPTASSRQTWSLVHFETLARWRPSPVATPPSSPPTSPLSSVSIMTELDTSEFTRGRASPEVTPPSSPPTSPLSSVSLMTELDTSELTRGRGLSTYVHDIKVAKEVEAYPSYGGFVPFHEIADRQRLRVLGSVACA